MQYIYTFKSKFKWKFYQIKLHGNAKFILYWTAFVLKGFLSHPHSGHL